MKRFNIKTALELFWVFFKIGLFTFGGGLAMISVISREVVENKKWMTEKEMGDIVIVAESTPGPIAVNSATYVGYKACGFLGSMFATLGVVLPSVIIISLVYVFFDAFKENVWFAAAFKGIRAAVIVLLFNAVTKLFRPMQKNVFTIIGSALVFLITLFTDISSIWLILLGGAIGVTYFLIKNAQIKRMWEMPADLADKSPKNTLKTGESPETSQEPNEKDSGENSTKEEAKK